MHAATEQKGSFKKMSSHFWLGGFFHACSEARVDTQRLSLAQGAHTPGQIQAGSKKLQPPTWVQPLLVSPSLQFCFSGKCNAISDLPSYQSLVLVSRCLPSVQATSPHMPGIYRGSGNIPLPGQQLVQHPSPSLGRWAWERCQPDDICRDVCSPSTPAPRHRRKRHFSFHIRSDGRGTRNPHWHQILHFLFE